MIGSILQILGEDIKALAWVERYGGLVKTYTNHNKQTFPISCEVSEADCRSDQRYQDLIPNDNKKSILYFEELGSLTDQGKDNKHTKRRKFVSEVRLVGWLNLQSLGLTACNASDEAIRSLLPLLLKEDHIISGGLLDGGVLNTRISKIPPKQHEQIFAKYNYAQNKAYWMYPYDFFAIDIKINLNLSLCDYTFITNAAIECVDNTRID